MAEGQSEKIRGDHQSDEFGWKRRDFKEGGKEKLTESGNNLGFAEEKLERKERQGIKYQLQQSGSLLGA